MSTLRWMLGGMLAVSAAPFVAGFVAHGVWTWFLRGWQL